MKSWIKHFLTPLEKVDGQLTPDAVLPRSMPLMYALFAGKIVGLGSRPHFQSFIPTRAT